MASPYKYSRLDLGTDAIRLVKLPRGDTFQPIQCEIIKTYLHQVEDVPYEALSYVWGTMLSAAQILIDGCKFGVTENLYEALVHLRRRDEDRVLWVDAICIDQSHSAERGHQVGQMRLVYQAAQRVIIWLGASNRKIDLLYDWMVALDERMVSTAQPNIISAWEDQWSFVIWQVHEKSPPREIREALSDLLRRNWFSRIWVLQEAALARSAVITCGRKEIDSRVFVVMPSLLRVKCGKGEQARLDILPGLLREKSWWARESGRDLLTLLRKFGESNASDTRDIIYALLGVSADAHSSQLLRPDYQMTTQEAIQQTVAYFLLQKHDICKNTPVKSLPKWSMREFLEALKDLDYEVFKWATDAAQDALLHDLIIRQRAKHNAERLDEYMSWTSYHGPLITIAIKRGNTDLLNLLLQSPDANVQAEDSDGKCPVAVAVEHGNTVAAHLIMQRRHFIIRRRDSLSDGNIPILVAAKQGGQALSRFLLGDFYARCFPWTLILTAARRGDLGTVEWILKHAQIDVSILSPNGDEAAARRKLKQREDRLMFVFGKRLRRELSPLELELVTGFSVITLQYEYGIYTKRKVHKITKPDEFRCLRRIVNVEARLKEGGWFGFQSPLGHAAQAGETRIVSLLLNNGADINSRDCDERASTPLCNAARRGHLHTVRLLVERGADIELTTETADESTALWCAASNGHIAVAKYLLEAGASVKMTADGSSTLLQSTVLICAAISSGQTKAMEAVRAIDGREGDA